MAEINKRITKIRLEFCGNSNAIFANYLGKSEAYASQLCSGGTNPSPKMLDHIISVFPAVSKSWLMLGEGDMLTGAATPPTAPAPTATTQATNAPTITNNGSGNNNHIGNSDNQSTIPEHVLRLYDSLLKEKDETISTLRDTIKTLAAEIEQLRNYVSLTSSKYINVMERMMYTTNETATIVKQCSAKIGFHLSEDTDKEPKL